MNVRAVSRTQLIFTCFHETSGPKKPFISRSIQSSLRQSLQRNFHTHLRQLLSIDIQRSIIARFSALLDIRHKLRNLLNPNLKSLHRFSAVVLVSQMFFRFIGKIAELAWGFDAYLCLC
jgi:hypothetical protein